VKDIDNYKFISDLGMEPFNDQIKEIKNLKMKNSKLLIVVPNNSSIECYLYK